MHVPPGPAIVLPVKGGPLAKSRLALALADRLALADAFARDTVAAVRGGLPSAEVLIVTADAGVGDWAGEAGCVVLPDAGDGLDAAVALGLGEAEHRRHRAAVVLLADHPALTATDLADALTALEPYASAVVPDADGSGTALLLVPLGTGPLPPTRFGPGSALAHADLGYTVVELASPRLRTDVDDAASLAAAVRLGVGPATAAALSRARLPGVQASIHRPPGDDSGRALLDDGREVEVPLASVVDSGLLHLRVGQRVSVELDADERVATRVWIVGIGPGETIR